MPANTRGGDRRVTAGRSARTPAYLGPDELEALDQLRERWGLRSASETIARALLECAGFTTTTTTDLDDMPPKKPRPAPDAPELIVLTASWCAPCRTFKASLARAEITHTPLDIEQPEGKALASRLRVQGIPQALVLARGRYYRVDSDVRSVRAALAKHGAEP